jgi:hypothetical protein
MSLKRLGALTLTSIGLSLVFGCADRGTALSADRLGAAVRGAGFPCARVVNSDEIHNGPNAWRVSCENATVYTANIQDGRICISASAYVDSVVPGVPPISPAESCISLGDI